MKIAFYGTARHVGTSANMAAVAAGFWHYLKIPAFMEAFPADTGSKIQRVSLFDCSRSADSEECIKRCDLLALNISFAYQNLEEAYFRHSLVQKNVVFLVGKYYQDRSDKLAYLAKEYRVDRSRICTLPYNTRFGYAYENQRVLHYVENWKKSKESYADLDFKKNLKHAVSTMIYYADRKGEMHYG